MKKNKIFIACDSTNIQRIKEILMDKRKVTLSIKYLEEQARDLALKTYGSESSGKNLPFSSLSEDLKKKEEEK